VNAPFIVAVSNCEIYNDCERGWGMFEFVQVGFAEDEDALLEWTARAK
jgi:hypothetical protein